MPRKHLIKKKKDFDLVLKNGIKIAGRFFTLLFKANSPESSNCSFGFIVKKSIAKKAVTRNKIKRRLKEIFRSLIPHLKNGNYIIIPNQEAVNTTFQQLKSDILNTLKKEKIINL